MGDTPRIIYAPSYDDCEGGPFPPAFTNREDCEAYVAALRTEQRTSLYVVEEWPLLDKAPVKIPFHQRGAQVHWDGYVCAGSARTMDRWDFEDPQSFVRPVAEWGYGIKVDVWVKDGDDLGMVFDAALAEAHARATAAGKQAANWCGQGCQHPQLRRDGQAV
jgi:hypothetical protein